MTHIQVILGSTRQGRFGDKVAQWFMQQAQNHDLITAELVDLADWPLPFFSSPAPPMMAESQDPQVLAWGSKLAEADGYVLVTPEYNHGYPAVLKNALDLVFRPWNGKPVGFVGYGGPAGGIRAVEQLRQVVVELEMIPMRQQVSIPNVYMAFDEAGSLTDLRHERTARAVLDELERKAASLKASRVRAA